MNDDMPVCERHEANYTRSEDYENQNSHDSYSHQSLYDPNDSDKSLTELNNDVRNDFEDFKSCIRSMRTDYDKFLSKTMMKQNEKNFQTIFKNMERKINEWEKHQNVSSEQTDRTDPPPPPQAHTEHVNAVFTGSEKSDDPPKIQKDPPPPIIVNDKIEKDRPIKTPKKNYYVVETKEYPFREYILKTPYPQRLNVDHSHLNRIVKHSLLVLRSPEYPKSKKNMFDEEEVLCQP
nr:hypothetical protein [Tanacetum cinerariifolium]